MQQLIYYSKATKVMQEDDLEDLLKQSREWNVDHDITGLLVYIEGIFNGMVAGRFMQVLEGSDFEIERLFNNIREDSRHYEVTLLKREEITNRDFSTWLMGFESIDLEKDDDIEGFFHMDDEVLRSKKFQESDIALDFLKSFYKTNPSII